MSINLRASPDTAEARRPASRPAAARPPAAQEDAPATRYRNQATQRVLAVLSTFHQARGAQGVTDIARTLGMTKTMVHRALRILGDGGYVVRDVSGERYLIGYRALALTARDNGDTDIFTLGRPYLQRLHALTGESVYLSIIVGNNRVTVDEILPPGPRVLRSLRGNPVPLHCTKMSRTLLAHWDDARIAAYLTAAAPLPRPLSIPDPVSETADGVWADIRAIRRLPHVIWRNPQHSSAAYAIFPILDEQKAPHAIVTVGGPRERFDIPRITALLPDMVAILEPLRRHATLFPAFPTRIGEGSA